MMKLNPLAALTLRTKLIVAIAVPLIALVALGVAQFQSLNAEASATSEQLAVVDRNVTLANVVSSVRTERDVQLTVISLASPLNRSEDGRNSYYDRIRGETDVALAEALQSSALSPADRLRLETIGSRLSAARTRIGSDPHQMRDDLIAELTSNAGASTSVSDALDAFDALVTRTIQLIDVEASDELNSQSALDLTTLQLSNAFDEAIRVEALSYLELSLLSQDQQTESLVRAARNKGAQSVQLENILVEVGNPDFAPAFSALLEGQRYQDFVQLRNEIAIQEVGEIAVPRNTVFFVLLALTNNLNDIKDEIGLTASTTASASNTSAQRQLLVGGGTLAALVVLVSFLAIMLSRSIRRPLLTLTERSRAIADTELPSIVTLLREEGVGAEVPEIVPIEAESNDEIGELVSAFNGMHQTAVALAAEQAGARRTVGDMFVNLGRRNQKLLIRILDELDQLEADERDAARLDALYRVDRLATRMRRNAESLLVLAGAQAARRVGQPVPVSEVARSAISEVERFDRVKISVRGDVLVDGAVVVDVAHLLAELIENALNASPDDSTVDVVVIATRSRFRIAIRDNGLGMDPEQREAANQLIRNAAHAEESPSKQLGLFVVGRLAARHGITVRIVEDSGIGLAVVVDLPEALIVGETDQFVRDLQQVDAPRLSRSAPVPSAPERKALAPADTQLADFSSPVPATIPDEWPQPAPQAVRPIAALPAAKPMERPVRLTDPPGQAPEPAAAGFQQAAGLPATTGLSAGVRRQPNATGFGSESESDNGFAVRRTPGANLPPGVEPDTAATSKPEHRAPSAHALSSNLGSFQRGTKRAIAHTTSTAVPAERDNH